MTEFENVFIMQEDAAIVLADLLTPLDKTRERLKATLTQELRRPEGTVYQVECAAGVEVEIAERAGLTAVTVRTGDTTRPGVPQEYGTVLRRLEERWAGLIPPKRYDLLLPENIDDLITAVLSREEIEFDRVGTRRGGVYRILDNGQVAGHVSIGANANGDGWKLHEALPAVDRLSASPTGETALTRASRAIMAELKEAAEFAGKVAKKNDTAVTQEATAGGNGRREGSDKRSKRGRSSYTNHYRLVRGFQVKRQANQRLHGQSGQFGQNWKTRRSLPPKLTKRMIRPSPRKRRPAAMGRGRVSSAPFGWKRT